MKPKRLASLIAVLGFLLFAGVRSARPDQSSDNYFYEAPFYCESYLVYDSSNLVVSGCSRTIDYENEGYEVGVEAYLYDGLYDEYYNDDMGEYEDAEADISAGDIAGTWTLYGEHWGVGTDWGCCEYDLGESQTSVDETLAIYSDSLGGSPWYAGSGYSVAIYGAGFSACQVTVSDPGGALSGYSFSVQSDTTITGSVQISSGLAYAEGVNIFACGVIAAVATAEPAQPVCAVPVNLQQYGPASTDYTGALYFAYSFGSSTGKLSDLASCSIREYLTYPGGPGSWYWPLPFPARGPIQNPNGNTTVPTTSGYFSDTHSLPPGDWRLPYFVTGFLVDQVYQFSCSCSSAGAWQDMAPHWSIDREITSNPWTYTIGKPNYTPYQGYTYGQISPLPDGND
jgi:hypothetical protein